MLGFTEVFRVPTDGEPIHADLELDGYRLGLAPVESTRDDHGVIVGFLHGPAARRRVSRARIR